ncbi:MAG: hypothetical protein CV045_02815 [Cyanobacteria bacterium M5B4]|nr:MAG: hypothetical protein CV045_02815 [Cyanobacteria bacterium M5B4]
MLIVCGYKDALTCYQYADNVVSVGDRGSNNFVPPCQGQNYLRLQFDDDMKISKSDLLPFFYWLQKVRLPSSNLIHCYMGISRSTALGLIFLIEKGWGINESISYLYRTRKFFCPNLKILQIYGNKKLIDSLRKYPAFEQEYRDFL